ncbi:rhodanese-like domain-containing protein [Paracnuella aquatica]|uniref:rhodanese-like domain-containing protein n=1 Tax=Paracnuella aquatica TaxID=2268757 RepID=UPI000DEFA13F|nr:rhodanese-like domain-containing protein [Paracnuella aquatica]RPD43780.1 rhodanese-like domain-containing protein [Paracnuella aquatica]
MPATLQSLSITAFKQAVDAGAIIVDTRPATVFTAGFVPGSISLGLEGSVAEWANALLPHQQALVLVTDAGSEAKSADLLAAEGFTKVLGYLEGGYEAWQQSGEEIDMIIDVEADELAMDLPFDENIVVLDVRRPAEFAEGHVVDAENVPLDEMADLVNIANIEEEQNVYIHCRSGYRSVIAASLLKRQGIHNIRNVLGGWNAIKAETRIKTEKSAAGDTKSTDTPE